MIIVIKLTNKPKGLTMRNITSLLFLIASLLLTASSLSAQFDFGKMTVKMDPDSEQMLKDAVSRRVSISPLNTSISKKTKKVSLEFHNPTDDTLEMEIKVSSTVPEMTKTIDSANSKVSKSLLSEKDAEITSIYKPLDKWITKYPKKLTLAPGEKKTIDVDILVPESVKEGEYASWIVAEVAPRKTLLGKIKEQTVSSSKIVYGGNDDKNKESESVQWKF